MFKRLFGKKKNEAETLSAAKDLLLENIREEALSKNISSSLDVCISFLEEGTEEELEDVKQSVFSLTGELAPALVVKAFSAYTGLLEQTSISPKDLERSITLYEKHIDRSLSFFEILKEEVKKGEEGDNDFDIDLDGIYHQLIRNRELVSEESAQSVAMLDALAQNLVNILAFDQEHITLAKNRLKSKTKQIKEYSQGSYWLDRLFDVLFDASVVVIDVDQHIGFEGKISGVADNTQLQMLLMAQPEFSDEELINEHNYSVITGSGIHISPAAIIGKWNMYNREIIEREGWDEIKIGPDKTLELQDLWIWLEGAPDIISEHDGKRVVLLGRPTYKRQMKVQRPFKNLKASVEVQQVLTGEEINTWLGIKE